MLLIKPQIKGNLKSSILFHVINTKNTKYPKKNKKLTQINRLLIYKANTPPQQQQSQNFQ